MAEITITIKDVGNEVSCEAEGDIAEVETKAQKLANVTMKIIKVFLEE